MRIRSVAVTFFFPLPRSTRMSERSFPTFKNRISSRLSRFQERALSIFSSPSLISRAHSHSPGDNTGRLGGSRECSVRFKAMPYNIHVRMCLVELNILQLITLCFMNTTRITVRVIYIAMLMPTVISVSYEGAFARDNN